MPPSSAETLTLLSAARGGDARAADLLFPRVYDELRRLAQARVAAERAGLTLGATGLVHEAYLKLVGGGDWQDRTHFTAVAARAIRQILTDHARARQTAKRGAAARPITLDADRMGAAPEPDAVVLAVDAALDRLAARDADLARLVELRFFGGLEVAEAAEALGVSPRTAARMWGRAKAHLRADLGADVPSGPDVAAAP